jgi:polar amino acid transport system substrate-binding protein
MRKHGSRWILAMVAVFALVTAACGSDSNNDSNSGGGGSSGSEPAGDSVCASADMNAGDALAAICDAGVIRVSTDPEYPPQSSLDVETGDYVGFDIDTATEIANRLGVDVAWETPAWEAIIAGNWGDRWDMSVGSMTVTEERSQVLDFTPAYYFTPAAIAVATDSDVTTPDQLSGQTIAVCAGCTYDFYLQGTLDIPGFTFPPSPITDAEIRGFNTDSAAVQAVEAGQAQGVMSSQTLLQGKIDKGAGIRIIGEPFFYEPLSVAFDKEADLDQTALVDAVSTIVDDMHADGTLSGYSTEWFGEDFTVEAEPS